MITFCSGKKCQSVGVTGSFVLRSDRRHHCRLGLLFRSAQWRCRGGCGRAENPAVLPVWRHCEHSKSNAISRTGACRRVRGVGVMASSRYTTRSFLSPRQDPSGHHFICRIVRYFIMLLCVFSANV